MRKVEDCAWGKEYICAGFKDSYEEDDGGLKY